MLWMGCVTEAWRFLVSGAFHWYPGKRISSISIFKIKIDFFCHLKYAGMLGDYQVEEERTGKGRDRGVCET